MDEKKNQSSGAPSSDTTSALFVSARKKQLEQQETERRAKEKEEQRLAAEAEVRRLELEVEERRRKAEEDARRVEEEAAEKMRQAAENANAAPSAAPSAPAARIEPKQAAPGAVGGLLAEKKLLAIIGGGAAALIVLVVVLVVTLGGGKGDPADAIGDIVSDYMIEGWYYLDGVYGEEALCFNADGMVEVYLPDAGTSGDSYVYGITGDALTIYLSDGSPLDFSVGMDGTLQALYSGRLYAEEGKLAAATEEPIEVEAAATAVPEPKAGDVLNAEATLADVGITISYPSSSFYVAENSGTGIVFSAHNGDIGSIGYIQSDISSVNLNSDQKLDTLYSIGSSVLYNISENYQDAIILADESYKDANNVIVYIGEATYVGGDGISYKLYVRSSFWSKTNTAYVVYTAARNSHYDACQALAVRIKDSVEFN